MIYICNVKIFCLFAKGLSHIAVYKSMIRTVLLHLLLFVTYVTSAQVITGKIADSQGDEVSNAVVILQNADAEFIRATTSDSLGVYRLDIDVADGLVVVQHLAYESKTVSFSGGNHNALKNIVLTDKTNQLGGVTVNAGTAMVEVRDNALIYNAQYIAENKSVSNAFELLKYTPGISTRNDEIELIGASQLTVIIDGKVTTLDNSDMADVLKSMPASQIGNIEVMYKAPAKYGVRGALINIVTDKTQHSTPLEAELATEYTQQFFASGRARANVAYRGDKIDFDVLANTSFGKERFEIADYSINQFNDIQTIVDQISYSTNENSGNTLRTSFDFNFNEDNSLSLLYYFKGAKYDEPIKSETKFLYHTGDTSLVIGVNDESDKNTLHNVNLKGVFGNATISADYVSYYDKIESKYVDKERDTVRTDYLDNSTMDIDQLKLLASYDWEFGENWQLSTGVQGTMTNSATEVSYLYPQNGVYELDKNTYGDNLQTERRFSVFGETINTLFDNIQFDFTLELEYFKSEYDENGVKSTLWDEWMLYPSLSVTWPLEQDAMQMSISTYKDYPTYWNLSPHTTQMNPYKFMVGNPKLKPATNFDFNFAYILKNQYTLEAYFFYTKDYFGELPYQNAEELRNYYQTVNFDFSMTGGVGAELPFSIGFWEPTLSGNLMYNRQKMSDFHNLPFDRDKFVFTISAYNTFAVSEKPNLKLTLDAAYISKDIQGIYDMSDGYNLEVGLKWGILENLTFTAKWSDIFEQWNGYPAKINFNNQYNRLYNKQFNCFNAALVWRIGGFKAKDVEVTDTERMTR